MPYAIMRFEKRKGGPASAIEKHHERKKEQYTSNPDVDTDRSPLNYHLIQPQHKYYAEIQSRIERAQQENPKCKVRKYSVKFIDTIVTATPEYLEHLVQEMLAENIKRRSKVRTKHPFAGKIVCGDCGGFYGHKVWRLRSTGERYDVWYCNHKYDGDEACDSPRLREAEIRDAFEKVLQACGDPNPAYADERWSELVQSVTVYRNNHLIFTLANGKTVKITL